MTHEWSGTIFQIVAPYKDYTANIVFTNMELVCVYLQFTTPAQQKYLDFYLVDIT